MTSRSPFTTEFVRLLSGFCFGMFHGLLNFLVGSLVFLVFIPTYLVRSLAALRLSWRTFAQRRPGACLLVSLSLISLALLYTTLSLDFRELGTHKHGLWTMLTYKTNLLYLLSVVTVWRRNDGKV